MSGLEWGSLPAALTSRLAQRTYPRGARHHRHRRRDRSFPVCLAPLSERKLSGGVRRGRGHTASQPQRPGLPTPRAGLFRSIPQPQGRAEAGGEDRLVLSPGLREAEARLGEVMHVGQGPQSRQFPSWWTPAPCSPSAQAPVSPVSTPWPKPGVHNPQRGCWPEPQPHTLQSSAGRPPGTSFSLQVALSSVLSERATVARGTLGPRAPAFSVWNKTAS